MDYQQFILAQWKTAGTAAAGYVVAPGSGATIVVWDSDLNDLDDKKGVLAKRLIWTNYVSHASATDGVTFEASFDGGDNWRLIAAYTDAAAVLQIHYVLTAAPRLRVRYHNDTNVLTAWEGCLVVDYMDRGTL